VLLSCLEALARKPEELAAFGAELLAAHHPRDGRIELCLRCGRSRLKGGLGEVLEQREVRIGETCLFSDLQRAAERTALVDLVRTARFDELSGGTLERRDLARRHASDGFRLSSVAFDGGETLVLRRAKAGAVAARREIADVEHAFQARALASVREHGHGRVDLERRTVALAREPQCEREVLRDAATVGVKHHEHVGAAEHGGAAPGTLGVGTFSRGDVVGLRAIAVVEKLGVAFREPGELARKRLVGCGERSAFELAAARGLVEMGGGWKARRCTARRARRRRRFLPRGSSRAAKQKWDEQRRESHHPHSTDILRRAGGVKLTIPTRRSAKHDPGVSLGFRALRPLVGLVPLLLGGCFIGYDSRWGQQKQAQQHLAAARTPTRLGASDSAASHTLPQKFRTMRIRIDATPTHAAQVVDYERHFQKQLDLANGMLEASLAIHLELAGTRTFQPTNGEDHLREVLDELCRADVGDDVDWVVGLAGSVPRFEDSFHELGMGQVIGKHLVVRALNDVAEYRAMQEGLTELSDAERDKLAHARLEHKGAVVLLHELGHTLGALHELDKTNVMNPRYATSVQRFGSETVDVMRAVLEHRTRSGELDGSGRQAVVALWRQEPAPWVPAERDAELSRLGATPPVAAKTTAPATTLPPAPATTGLSPSDELAFREASQRLARGDANGAFEVGKPLFDAHPDVPAVAELRCNIALHRGAPYEQVRKECAGVMQGAFGAR